ncbi:L domain-like protein [Massarina eburnea CBS 473.64]|uniref:L domain-like protein n=1 Tax=Massarina eburnea CBS 473.64 TaxID=1395130 RepID=A0A6A6RKU3_9PLEO|nr:L domain-like protein [Massarina eburnea CBS 473.64]
MADASETAGKAPHIEVDPAATNPTAVPAHDADKKDKPRDSKGWDGKLRLDRSVLTDGPPDPQAQSDPEVESEDDEEAGAKREKRTEIVQGEDLEGEQLAADEDLLDGYTEDEEEIDLVHLRISSIPALRLERFKQLRRLCLRQNAIQDVEIPSSLAPTLVELDLYDNLISHVRGFDALTNLESLDLSFNKIKHVKRVNHLTKLKDLYFVQNKISTIENLEGLSNLRQIEFGANRIREIQNLEPLAGLEELWLGKNKITELKGLSTLTNLKILSIQSNRLTHISNLESLSSLEELYVSHNAITAISNLDANTNLRVIDVSANPLEHLSGLSHLAKLQEFWASSCKLDSFDEVENELGGLQELETVYLEGNPLQKRQMALYRNKVRLALPRVKQIDATFVRA